MERISKFKNILAKVTELLQNNSKTNFCKILVVSKKRPIEQILEIYNEGHRDFGENYVNELLEKSEKLPQDINWHLIGHLQTNKCKKLLSTVKNLFYVESVDSLSLAEELNKTCMKLDIERIKVYLQINISGESSKSGMNKQDVLEMFEQIKKHCERVHVVGIMSLGDIGSIDQFQEMLKIKLEICEKFGIKENDFTVSMGTSDDYEEAITQGSNEVRIGGLLFDV